MGGSRRMRRLSRRGSPNMLVLGVCLTWNERMLMYGQCSMSIITLHTLHTVCT